MIHLVGERIELRNSLIICVYLRSFDEEDKFLCSSMFASPHCGYISVFRIKIST